MSLAVHRLHWVDAARGLAALSVAIMHMFERLRALYPSNDLFRQNGALGFIITDFFYLGKVGVVVFFIISGYVIPFSLLGRNLKQFIVTRFFRLYPAYWFSILIAIFLINFSSWQLVLWNFTMFQRFIGVPDLVGVYWTLQIEIVFYFLCAGLFYWDKLFNLPILTKAFYLLMAGSLLMAGARYLTEIRLPVVLPLSLSVMFLGVILRAKQERDEMRFNEISKFLVVYLVVLLLVCLLAYNKDYGHNETWYKYFVSYTAGLLIFAGFKCWKSYSRLLMFLGRISYSLYLLHPVFGLALTNFLKKDYYPEMSALMYTGLFLTFSILSATICFYGIEKPGVKMGKRLVKKCGALNYNAFNS